MKANQNKGFSYIEMLMVLAIMAIMIGMITISIGTVKRNTALRASEKLETLVNKARVNALTKGTAHGYVNVALYEGAYYAYVGERVPADLDNDGSLESRKYVKEHGDKICNENATIYFNGLVKNNVNHIQFKQATGGLVGTSDTISVVCGNTSSVFRIKPQTGKTYRHEEEEEE